MIWVENLLGIIYGEKSTQSKIHTQPGTSPGTKCLVALGTGKFFVNVKR